MASSSFQPSRIGFGSIFGAPRPAGRIAKWTRGATSSTLPILPSTVPAITCEPSFSCRMSIALESNRTTPEKYDLNDSYPGNRSFINESSWPVRLARSTFRDRSGNA